MSVKKHKKVKRNAGNDLSAEDATGPMQGTSASALFASSDVRRGKSNIPRKNTLPGFKH